jgi:hypothetical protein
MCLSVYVLTCLQDKLPKITYTLKNFNTYSLHSLARLGRELQPVSAWRGSQSAPRGVYANAKLSLPGPVLGPKQSSDCSNPLFAFRVGDCFAKNARSDTSRRICIQTLAQALCLCPPPCRSSASENACPAYFPPSWLLEGRLLALLSAKRRGCQGSGGGCHAGTNLTRKNSSYDGKRQIRPRKMREIHCNPRSDTLW